MVIGGREEDATNALKRVPMGIHKHIHEG